ncbi:hypothetical protein CPB86DRAFT_829143 [Serendipita vermifera]|nr:hypothetical protein CPB86DRAFT_829143 [Serendipita vermifera]
MSRKIKRALNAPPTASETKHIREFIATQENDISILTKSLIKEKERLSAGEKAVLNLNRAIRQLKALIDSHRENFASLQSIQQRFQANGWTQRLEMQDQPETAGQYEALTTHIARVLAKSSPVIDDQITVAESDIKELSNSLNQLEDELVGWKFVRDLAKDRVTHLTTSIDLLKPGLKSAKQSLSPIYRTYREIWILVFEEYLTIRLEEYLEQPDTLPFRPPTHVLSSVCTTWRNIVLTQPSLWTVITIDPSNWLSRSEHGLLCLSLLKAGERFTFICNLSQRLEWFQNVYQLEHYGPHDDNIGREYRHGEVVNSAVVPPEKSWTTQLVINQNHNSYAQRTASVPFRSREHLKLTFQSGGDQGHVQEILSHFRRLNRFEFSDKGSRIVSLGTVAESLASLTHLRITIEDMPAIDMTNILNPGLVELRITHNGQNLSTRLPSILGLSQLKILGITYPDVALLESLDAPALRDLELHGSTSQRPECVLEASARDILSRISNLSFHDWKVKPVDGMQISPGGVFKQLAASMPSLRTVKFMNCQLNGGTLVELFKSRLTSDSPVIAQLEGISFTGCSIITRTEYEIISEAFPSIKFFLWVGDYIVCYISQNARPKSYPNPLLASSLLSLVANLLTLSLHSQKELQRHRVYCESMLRFRIPTPDLKPLLLDSQIYSLPLYCDTLYRNSGGVLIEGGPLGAYFDSAWSRTTFPLSDDYENSATQ